MTDKFEPLAESTFAQKSSKNVLFHIKLPLRKATPTEEMVNHALYELHNRKGNSLYAIKKYIEEKNLIKISKQRNELIKKHLHSMKAKGEVVNVTGRGLVGRIRLSPGERKKLRQHSAETLSLVTVSLGNIVNNVRKPRPNQKETAKQKK